MAPSFLYPFNSEGQFHLPIPPPSINAFFNFTSPLETLQRFEDPLSLSTGIPPSKGTQVPKANCTQHLGLCSCYKIPELIFKGPAAPL